MDNTYMRLSRKGRRRWRIMRAVSDVIIAALLFAGGWLAAYLTMCLCAVVV